ncbi:head-tail connector protein [Paenibacillus chibensis]|uniref:Head-tail connector protein n=1 Tax=Paenibacillus chibensis TaxID=59846 RepID=A0ABU6PSR2_9BACL|nr:head-tail connector protein [Paenibacillus chibensis]
MDLQYVKDYLRVDYEDDDLLINGFISAAKQYLRNAGVADQEESDLYNTVILMLVSLFYENREVTDKDIKIPTVINTLIVQLSVKRTSA